MFGLTLQKRIATENRKMFTGFSTLNDGSTNLIAQTTHIYACA